MKLNNHLNMIDKATNDKARKYKYRGKCGSYY